MRQHADDCALDCFDSLAEPPPLAPDEVHVWSVSLMHEPPCVTRFAACMSADELTRAAAFYFPELRRRYTVARGALRHLLGQYMQIPAESVTFHYGPLGKPALAGVAAQAPLTFNVSHSGEMALIAVALDRHVGVDLEWMRAIDDIDGIARQNYSLSERSALQRHTGDARIILFYQYWTRKESLVKATGDGLSIPLPSVDVSALSQGPAAVVRIYDGSGAQRQFAVCDLLLPAGYVGALAVEATRAI